MSWICALFWDILILQSHALLISSLTATEVFQFHLFNNRTKKNKFNFVEIPAFFYYIRLQLMIYCDICTDSTHKIDGRDDWGDFIMKTVLNAIFNFAFLISVNRETGSWLNNTHEMKIIIN